MCRSAITCVEDPAPVVPIERGAVTVEKVDYDDRQHAVYAQGRAVSPAMIAAWMKVFAGHAPARRRWRFLTGAQVPGGSHPPWPGRSAARFTGSSMPDLWWHQFFPRAAEIEKEMVPAVGQVEQAFSAAGLEILALEPVSERFADSMTEGAARLRLRAISTFEYLTA